MNAFVGNLRLAHKFLLLGVIALLMLAIPGIGLVRANLERMQGARAEMAGIEPAGAALELIRLTQQHRGLSAGVLAGNAAMLEQRAAKQQDVERALAQAQASAARLDDAGLQGTLARIADTWKALASEVSAKSLPGAQSFARHTALIDEQLGLLQDISHVSGIVFESDPASYYLQAAVLGALPLLTEDLGQMRARGSALLARGEASAGDRARFEAMMAQLQRHQRDLDKLLALAGRSDATLGRALQAPIAAARQSADEARKLMTEKILQAEHLSFQAPEYFAQTTRAIDLQFKLVDAGFVLLADHLTRAANAARDGLIALLCGMAALAALGSWIMLMATRSTTRSVGRALQLAEAVAAGDLRTRVQAQGRDEIAQLLRALEAMNQSLVDVVSGVRKNAESVASASAEIAQGNQDLSSRTEQQAAALEQTAATMDELGSTVRSTAEHARQANELAQSTRSVVQRGSAAVGQVVETMKGINASSRRIADITGTIDGIAFQTNILALNAAVEAARAGELGRGFAVVAGEVRALAQRAAEAAREIKLLIAASVQSVEQGTAQVDRAGATMSEVVAAIERVTQIVGDISHACGEQGAGVSQVGEAVSQMDHGTQQNAALVEQGAAAAQSLRQQADQLVGLVAVFKLEGARA